MDKHAANGGTAREWGKVCFVIGPMKNDQDIARQKRLATEILEPLLAQSGYVVQTPDVPEQKQIMNQVIAALDRADLVVADITSGNPSVLYELGIRHCIGLPTIMVQHKRSKAVSGGKSAKRVPFDLSHYRYKELDLDNSAAAQEALKATVEATLAQMRIPGPQGQSDNPVTEYYKGWPMIEGSPAAGLALGYYLNMVKRAAEALSRPDAQASLLDDKKRPTQLAIDEIKRLNVYIPRQPDLATVSYLDAFIEKMNAQNCEITAPGRPVRTYFVEQDHALLDIPTTLGAINEAVRRRVPDDPGLESDIARFVASRELDRFDSALKRLISDERQEPYKMREFLKNRVAFYDLWADSSGQITANLTLERVSQLPAK